MASGVFIHCTHCSVSTEAWDEGNPYIVDHRGERQYCHHPGGEGEIVRVRSAISAAKPSTLAEDAGRLGNESDLCCLGCGKISSLDPAVDIVICSECGGNNLHDVMGLGDLTCPKCRKGTMKRDDGRMMIS